MLDSELARNIRRDIIEMARNGKASHSASALSIADIVAVLYNGILNIAAGTHDPSERDRFVLSKGHAGAAVYAALAETGFIPREELLTFYGDNTRLSGHISHKNVPTIDVSSGSLGQGVCMATGFALAGKKMDKSYRVYAIVGDGECNEGSVWETALFASHHKLDNFTVIVDRNGWQAILKTEETLALGDLGEKWRAFGWETIDINGHDYNEIHFALSRKTVGKPLCVIAHTTKGKGVSFMENTNLYHYRDPQGEWYKKAISEIGGVGL